MENSGGVTELLQRSRGGDKQAFDELLPFVHAQLEKLARSHLRSARRDQTLRTTALVNEAYLKLVGAEVEWKNSGHFFAIASRVMRQILVDHARARRSDKRGGGAVAVTLDEALVGTAETSIDVLLVDQLLAELEVFDERKCRLLELLYFGGLTAPEAAQTLGISEPTLFRDLKLAKAWMQNRLRGA